MSFVEHVTTSEPRFEALKAKHSSLEQEIHQLQQRYPSDEVLKSLKRAKLKIKEEMESIRQTA